MDKKEKNNINAAADETTTAAADETTSTAADEVKADDPSLVSVTVIVVATAPANDYFLLRQCLRSLNKNLRGVDAQVKVIGNERPGWIDCDTFLLSPSSILPPPSTINNAILETLKLIDTARIIILSDRMMLLRPVSIADIALLKALPENEGNKTVTLLAERLNKDKRRLWNYQNNMPFYAFTDTLEKLLRYLEEQKMLELHLPTAYNNLLYEELQPTLLDWKTDGWLLPVVTEQPSMDAVKKFLPKKKFLFVSEKSQQKVISLLKFLFPDPTAAENDVKNENLQKD